MEIDGSLDHYRPDDPSHFGIWVQAFIGSTDDDLVDSFDILVCTPGWLAEHFDDERLSRWPFEAPDLLFGSRCVFMERWDYEILTSAVKGLCDAHEAADWGTLANRIGRFLPWEFDYRYDRFIDKRHADVPAFPPTADAP